VARCAASSRKTAADLSTSSLNEWAVCAARQLADVLVVYTHDVDTEDGFCSVRHVQVAATSWTLLHGCIKFAVSTPTLCSLVRSDMRSVERDDRKSHARLPSDVSSRTGSTFAVDPVSRRKITFLPSTRASQTSACHRRYAATGANIQSASRRCHSLALNDTRRQSCSSCRTSSTSARVLDTRSSSKHAYGHSTYSGVPYTSSVGAWRSVVIVAPT